MDCSLPGLSDHGILQAKIVEWVAVSFSRVFFQPRDQAQVTHITSGFFTSWATREAPIAMVKDQSTYKLSQPNKPEVQYSKYQPKQQS